MSLLTVSGGGFSARGAPILRDVGLTLGPTGSVAVIGPNGAGKSTLLKLLAGLVTPTAGTVELDGRPIHSLPAKLRAQSIGYIPQQFEPYWDLTVDELLELGGSRAAVAEPGAREAAASAFELSALLPRRWSTLSGGERSRALLATVLVVDPPVLLADEPSAALDVRHRLDLVRRLAARGRERLCVVAMHDLELALTAFDRVVLMADGGVVLDGPAAEVARDPAVDRVFGVAFERAAGADGGLWLRATGGRG